MSIPILIPLGCGSKHNNWELRILLRSIERNAENVGQIFLITTCAPEWITGITVVPFPDIYHDCKDANLFHKIHNTLKLYDIDDFIFTADDAVFTQKIDLQKIPVIHNNRENEIFYTLPESTWKTRVRNTLEWAKSRGVNLAHNFECHCPQLFSGKKILDGMKNVHYYNPHGKTIYTTWRVVTDTYEHSVNQLDYKYSFEKGEDLLEYSDAELLEKMFIGYNDSSASAVLRRMRNIFTEKSRYEK